VHPQTVSLRFETSPVKLQLVLNGKSIKASFTSTVIMGSRNTITAPSPQIVGNTEYRFVSWSDGGAQAHDILAGTGATVYTGAYAKVSRR
jgi:hypothetical protein